MIFNIQNWILKSPDTVKTLNRILKHHYISRGNELPTNDTKKKVNDGCVLRFCRATGKFQRIAHLDYTMFYPSIVYGLKLNPSTDHMKSYRHLLLSVMKALNNTEFDEQKKIKGFLTKMCSGWLNSDDFVFRDSKMHRKVLMHGTKILKRAVTITDSDPKFRILTVNTDGMYVQCLETNNIRKHFHKLSDKINFKINKSFLKIRVKNVWTDIHVFNTLKYHVHNSFTGDYAFKGMEDWLYNFNLKCWREENDINYGTNGQY